MVKSNAPPVHVSYHWSNGAAGYGSALWRREVWTPQPGDPSAAPAMAAIASVMDLPFGSVRALE